MVNTTPRTVPRKLGEVGELYSVMVTDRKEEKKGRKKASGRGERYTARFVTFSVTVLPVIMRFRCHVAYSFSPSSALTLLRNETSILARKNLVRCFASTTVFRFSRCTLRVSSSTLFYFEIERSEIRNDSTLLETRNHRYLYRERERSPSVLISF